jgi:hypothetical protein
VVFEEGPPSRTLVSAGEQIPLFDANIEDPLTNHIPEHDPDPAITADVDEIVANQPNQQGTPAISAEPRRSTRAPQPSTAGSQSMEYKARKATGKGEGQDWASDHKRPHASITIDYAEDDENVTVCLTDTKASHFIPRSY